MSLTIHGSVDGTCNSICWQGSALALDLRAALAEAPFRLRGVVVVVAEAEAAFPALLLLPPASEAIVLLSSVTSRGRIELVEMDRWIDEYTDETRALVAAAACLGETALVL